ncbi:hypothetical protein ElyMa_006913700 [Elysia marginata]|uniref:Uncharacterized protein n=1 Tax=Elysia marginata TaxID=1093978 RepID=A0AAV4JF64_9GAST|nr:hypothetical protein ElyMa_006913700 [Elysia marginata]
MGTGYPLQGLGVGVEERQSIKKTRLAYLCLVTWTCRFLSTQSAGHRVSLPAITIDPVTEQHSALNTSSDGVCVRTPGRRALEFPTVLYIEIRDWLFETFVVNLSIPNVVTLVFEKLACGSNTELCEGKISLLKEQGKSDINKLIDTMLGDKTGRKGIL